MKHTSITVVGNLITPVNRRNLPDGRSVASFRIACTERRVDRLSGEWGDGETFYIGVTCWRELAANVASSLGVGDPIMVRGRIYTSSYDDKEGRRNTVQEIDADAVGPDLARCRVSNLLRNRRASEAADGASEQDLDEPADDLTGASTPLHRVPALAEPENLRDPVPAGGR